MHHPASIAAFALALACATPALSAYSSAGSAVPGATIEDFEDGLWNLPGVTVSGGFLEECPDWPCNSVDADDGVIDGSGARGRSWTAGGSTLKISFDASVLGGLPLWAGVVLTDVGARGRFDAAFQVDIFGRNGTLVSSLSEFFFSGVAREPGDATEDRFYGAYLTSGISAIALTNLDPECPAPGAWQIDHVQYSFVPEPASALLIGWGLAVLSAVRRDSRASGARPAP